MNILRTGRNCSSCTKTCGSRDNKDTIDCAQWEGDEEKLKKAKAKKLREGLQEKLLKIRQKLQNVDNERTAMETRHALEIAANKKKYADLVKECDQLDLELVEALESL